MGKAISGPKQWNSCYWWTLGEGWPLPNPWGKGRIYAVLVKKWGFEGDSPYFQTQLLWWSVKKGSSLSSPLSFLLCNMLTIMTLTSQGCLEVWGTFVHGEPCTQLVLNGGRFCAVSRCRPTEGGSVCKGSCRLCTPCGVIESEPSCLRAKTADPSSGEKYVCTVPQTLLLTCDTVPTGGWGTLASGPSAEKSQTALSLLRRWNLGERKGRGRKVNGQSRNSQTPHHT